MGNVLIGVAVLWLLFSGLRGKEVYNIQHPDRPQSHNIINWDEVRAKAERHKKMQKEAAAKRRHELATGKVRVTTTAQ